MNITYKPLKVDFVKKGFQFNQLYREGDIALFHKVGLKGSIHTKNFDGGFEVIVISRHKEYELGGVKIEAAECAPSDEQWGTKGWTYTNLYDAERKFKQLVSGEIKVDNTSDEEPEIESEEEETVETVPSVKSSNPVKSGRGRPRVERPILQYPDGEFSCKELAAFNKVEYPIASVVLREQEAQGLVVRTREERRAPKGPMTQLFKKA
jgi:hypothetical protein